MIYTLKKFNQLNPATALLELEKCCGAKKWVETLMAHFPFANEKALFEKVGQAWYQQCTEEDYLEAFHHHPKIGEKNLREKFASTEAWAGKEQSGVAKANDQTISELAELNERYYQKFGYIFIVFATGKSAEEMLQLLKIRLEHDPDEELQIAMGEQHKITLLRLQKLLELTDPCWSAVSQITTHVLDTSIGVPGKGICIKLKKEQGKIWQTVAMGITNADGRIGNLLPAGQDLPPGDYLMHFDTYSYFQTQQLKSFYPKVDIHFTTFDTTHYHVPLLINPFGYSKYRGS